MYSSIGKQFKYDWKWCKSLSSDSLQFTGEISKWKSDYTIRHTGIDCKICFKSGSIVHCPPHVTRDRRSAAILANKWSMLINYIMIPPPPFLHHCSSNVISINLSSPLPLPLSAQCLMPSCTLMPKLSWNNNNLTRCSHTCLFWALCFNKLHLNDNMYPSFKMST